MPILNTGQQFASGDQVTSQKLMDIADLATFDDPADGVTIIANNATYGIDAGDGKLKVKTAGITSTELATDSVTTAKIKDGAVTSAKLASAAISSIMPSGVVMPYAGSEAPNGFLFCAGQSLVKADYESLWDAIGYTYGGTGDNFTLPDLRGRVVAGKDNMITPSQQRLTNLSGGVDGDTLGATGGDEKHELLASEIPAHDHLNDTPVGGRTADELKVWHDTQSGYNGTRVKHFGSGDAYAGVSTMGSLINSFGGDQPHNNVQPTIILNYIIKT